MAKNLYLFTTPICKLCPQVKNSLDKLGVEYEAINAILEASETKKYFVRTVPHVVIFDGEDVLYSKGGADNQDYNKIKEILAA